MPGALMADHLRYHGPLNLVWMLGAPVLVAIFANRDIGRQALFGIWLTFAALVSLMLASAIFGLGD